MRLDLEMSFPSDDEVQALRGMSPAEKLDVMAGLIRQAYRLKAAWIRHRHPDLSDAEVLKKTAEAIAGERT